MKSLLFQFAAIPIPGLAWLFLSSNVYAISDDLLRTIALSTSIGQPGASQFAYPIINDVGDTAFTSYRTHGSGITDVWMNSPVGGTRLVASKDEPAPGMPAGAVFTHLISLAIDETSHITVGGQTFGSGVTELNDDGLWSEEMFGDLTLVIREGDPAVGTSAGVLFDGSNETLFDTAGRLTYDAVLRGAGVNENNARGIWWFDDAGLQLVVRGGDLAPGTAGSFMRPSLKSMNDNGQVLIESSLTNGASGRGIWSWQPGGAPNLIARSGQVVPGQPGATSFGNLIDPRGNNAGEIVFFDAGGVNERIWARKSGGGFRLVAQEGTQAPGTPSGVIFSEIDASALINSAGHTSIWARLSGAGVNGENNEGIWMENNSGLQLVARTGEHAPGTLFGTRFFEINDHAVNGFGQVAFAGIVSGVGVNSMNDSGIWVQQRDGTLRLVIREGDSIDVDDGPGLDLRTVAVLSATSFVFNSGNEDGWPSMFNDAGQLVFQASFVDGSSGVFVSHVGAVVPEPRAIALVWIAAIVIASRARN